MAATARRLDQTTRVLASDEYEGRLPGTRGDTLTVAYLVARYREIGLSSPLSVDDYTQAVPFMTPHVEGTATLRTGAGVVSLATPSDLVVRDMPPVAHMSLGPSGAAFVGYGIVASEHGWDDYKNADVRGKVVFMLVGVPRLAGPKVSASSDSTHRVNPDWGLAGTAAGKIVTAKNHGAIGVVLVHDSGLAGFPFKRIADQFGPKSIKLDTTRADTAGRWMAVFVPRSRAQDMLIVANQNLVDLERRAADPAFVPVPIDGAVSITATQTFRRFTSPNVIGKLEGAELTKRDEVVVYSAHWDHLGRDTALKGHQIYNGASDNAGGVAQMLEVARAFSRMSPRPKRTILFIATTGEEEGLLGAWYYVKHPAYPLDHTVADINLDFFTPWGRTQDVIDYGPGGTTLDDILEGTARAEGRTVTPDPTPQEHFFERSDQYPFAALGVPAMFPAPGVHYVGRPDGYGQRMDSLHPVYHDVTDQVLPDWDLSGAAQEVEFLTRVGYAIAQDDGLPVWKPTTVCQLCRRARLPKAAP
jgi:hypothetical protein